MSDFADGFRTGLMEAVHTLRTAAEEHKADSRASKKVLEAQAHELAAALLGSWAEGLAINANRAIVPSDRDRIRCLQCPRHPSVRPTDEAVAEFFAKTGRHPNWCRPDQIREIVYHFRTPKLEISDEEIDVVSEEIMRWADKAPIRKIVRAVIAKVSAPTDGEG